MPSRIAQAHIHATVLLALASAAPAFAHTPTDPYAPSQSIVVQLGDIDIRTAAGAKIASSRIKSAARNVCGDANVERTYAERALVQRCAATAIRDASITLHQAMLSALIDETAAPVRLASR